MQTSQNAGAADQRLTSATEARPIWLRGPQLRQRWGGMANSTFYNRLTRGLIPPPEYPFGPTTPYWRMAVIERHEQQAQGATA